MGLNRLKRCIGLLLALVLLMCASCAGAEDTPSQDGTGEGSAVGESVGESFEESAADASLAESSSAASLPADDSPEPDAGESPEPEHIHVFVGATCTEAGVCECGETEAAFGHDFTAATCTAPSVCTRCGETGEPALGHDNAGATCGEPGVCSRCGATGSALGHDFAAATCTEPSVCKRCGVTEGEALGHTYSGGVCTRCGDTNGPLSPEEAKLFKNRLTDEENAQALAAAREIASRIESTFPAGSDLDRIAMAAQLVSNEYSKGVHIEEGIYYHTAYGVFIKRESSCAGCCRALGLVLSCMGYQWTHVNENQWTHQWVTVSVGGESIWADGQIGWAGVGTYPFA